MSLQKYLQHELNINLEGSNSVLVAPLGMGALAQLYTDIQEISQKMNESVTVVTVDASALNQIGFEGFNLQDIEKISNAKNAVLIVETDNATTAQMNLVSELLFDRNPQGLDISHAHVVLFTHNASTLPSALTSKVTVFPEGALLTINKDRIASHRAENAVCLPYDQHPDSKSSI